MRYAKHRLTPLREVTLDWSDIAQRLFRILFVFRGAISPEFLLMDGSAHSHKDAEVSKTLENEDINCMQ